MPINTSSLRHVPGADPRDPLRFFRLRSKFENFYMSYQSPCSVFSLSRTTFELSPSPWISPRTSDLLSPFQTISILFSGLFLFLCRCRSSYYFSHGDSSHTETLSTDWNNKLSERQTSKPPSPVSIWILPKYFLHSELDWKLFSYVKLKHLVSGERPSLVSNRVPVCSLILTFKYSPFSLCLPVYVFLWPGYLPSRNLQSDFL